MEQQQQHQPQQQYSASQPQPQPPQPTTSAKEEEEEVRTLWIGDLQQWMDKVEEKEVRTLWIGELQHWMDEAYINLCFAHTEEVFTSKVIRNKKTGKSECYGFIEFKSHAISESFLHKFNGTPMPRVAGNSNFSLNWASSSSFGSGGENQQQQLQEDDDCAADDFTKSVVGDDDDDDDLAAAAASDIVTTDFMLPQEIFTSVKHLEKVNSSWEDMLKWWSIAQGTPTPQAVHAAHRVYLFGVFFKRPYIFLEKRYLTPKEVEEMLDELPAYVDSIDIAKELHTIGALVFLFGKLTCDHAGIRAKTAKVIRTIVQNNPSSRQLVMEEGGGDLLYNSYLVDADRIVQTNALDAISSLYRNGERDFSAFGENGYADLIYGFETECVKYHRKAFNLIARLVAEHNSDYNIITSLEYPSIMMRMASSGDAEVRKAALRCLSVLAIAEKKGGNSGQLVKNDKLKQVLRELIEGISLMAPGDVGAARGEEIQLLDSLWNACYNEPSSLLSYLCNLVRIVTQI